MTMFKEHKFIFIIITIYIYMYIFLKVCIFSVEYAHSKVSRKDNS